MTLLVRDCPRPRFRLKRMAPSTTQACRHRRGVRLRNYTSDDKPVPHVLWRKYGGPVLEKCMKGLQASFIAGWRPNGDPDAARWCHAPSCSSRSGIAILQTSERHPFMDAYDRLKCAGHSEVAIPTTGVGRHGVEDICGGLPLQLKHISFNGAIPSRALPGPANARQQALGLLRRRQEGPGAAR